jgi:hypothetical protein
MNIHSKINAKSWNDRRHTQERFGVAITHEPQILVSLALEITRRLRTYLSSPQHYCHECSHEYKKPVYHREAPTPYEQMKQYKRTTLQGASEIYVIETQYPYYF